MFEFIYRSALLLWNTELKPLKKKNDDDNESDSGPEFDADVKVKRENRSSSYDENQFKSSSINSADAGIV